MFKTILVPTDASESAQHALKVAIDLAKEFGSRIVLLHVVYTPEALGYTLSSGITVPQEEISIYGSEALTAALAGLDTGNVPIEKKRRLFLSVLIILLTYDSDLLPARLQNSDRIQIYIGRNSLRITCSIQIENSLERILRVSQL